MGLGDVAVLGHGDAEGVLARHAEGAGRRLAFEAVRRADLGAGRGALDGELLTGATRHGGAGGQRHRHAGKHEQAHAETCGIFGNHKAPQWIKVQPPQANQRQRLHFRHDRSITQA